MNYQAVTDQIKTWLIRQLETSGQRGFVVGVSGGVDSALVSTLCAMTGKPTILATIPIAISNTYTHHEHENKALMHMQWLKERYSNVSPFYTDITQSWSSFLESTEDLLFQKNPHGYIALRPLVSANLQSRLRMCVLYAFANASRFLVVGTGNKVEDFGIGFCTKHGDAAVDISPIGDLMKSEVQQLAAHLGVHDTIVKAAPTDGLWDDGRTDADQIGTTYEELEQVMTWLYDDHDAAMPSNQALLIYLRRHSANKHKMMMPPICKIER